jgi:hypothetical protein
MDADALNKWLNLLDGYFLSIIFLIEKRLPVCSLRLSPMSRIGGRLTVSKWKLRNLQQRAIEECTIFVVTPTLDSFRDALKEQYYPIGRYDDWYMRWTTLRQERDQTMLEFTNIFHTLCTKLGFKESE